MSQLVLARSGKKGSGHDAANLGHGAGLPSRLSRGAIWRVREGSSDPKVKLGAAADYLAAINALHRNYAVGVYGGFYAVSRLLSAGLATMGWQTSAWSGGQWDNRAVLRQFGQMWGGNADVNTALPPRSTSGSGRGRRLKGASRSSLLPTAQCPWPAPRTSMAGPSANCSGSQPTTRQDGTPQHRRLTSTPGNGTPRCRKA